MEILIVFGIILTVGMIAGLIKDITDHYLLKKINANPEQRDNLINSYWAKDFLDSDFYEKCQTLSEKLQQELDDAYDTANDINDFIAIEKYSELLAQCKKIDEKKAEVADAKRRQENSQKLKF